MVDIFKEEMEQDYYSIVNEVEKKLKEYNSTDWVEKYAKLQEVTKVTMKKICGSITVVHTVANPDSFSVTRFYSVGLDLKLIDAEKEMAKYHSVLRRLLQVKNFDAAEKFLSDESEISSDDQTQNVLFIDDEYQNTVLIAAAYYGAPLSFLETLWMWEVKIYLFTIKINGDRTPSLRHAIKETLKSSTLFWTKLIV